jgi:hypothetical protein
MIRLSKSVLAVGGVILAAGLITVMNPRTVHAVAAVLVQVTNTASNPVVAQGIDKQATQIVELTCGYTLVPKAPDNVCSLENADGTPGGTTYYTVPNGQSLVIDSVDITTGIQAGTPCGSSAFVELSVENPATTQELAREWWLLPAGTGTAHYVYPSGIVLPGGTGVHGLNVIFSPCTVGAQFHGYLTTQ